MAIAVVKPLPDFQIQVKQIKTHHRHFECKKYIYRLLLTAVLKQKTLTI